VAGAPRGIRRGTKIKYLQIYERRKRRHGILEIAAEFACTPQLINKAIRYCQSWALDLTDVQELQLLIDAKEDRIRWIYNRLDTLSGGVEYAIEKKDYIERGSKIYPSSEAHLLKELHLC